MLLHLLPAFYAKVRYGAIISIATMGPPIAESALQQAQLISDADSLHLYSDRIFSGADTLATAEVLKAGINQIGKMDIVLFRPSSLRWRDRSNWSTDCMETRLYFPRQCN